MQQLNAAFRGVSKTTDVLSFPQISGKLEVRSNKLKKILLGDVVINIQMAVSRAKLSGADFYDEVYHLLIHGILHLLGYDHEKSRHKAVAMMKKEKEILGAIKKMG